MSHENNGFSTVLHKILASIVTDAKPFGPDDPGDIVGPRRKALELLEKLPMPDIIYISYEVPPETDVRLCNIVRGIYQLLVIYGAEKNQKFKYCSRPVENVWSFIRETRCEHFAVIFCHHSVDRIANLLKYCEPIMRNGYIQGIHYKLYGRYTDSLENDNYFGYVRELSRQKKFDQVRDFLAEADSLSNFLAGFMAIPPETPELQGQLADLLRESFATSG